MMNATVLKQNISFAEMGIVMTEEITSLGISVESSEIILGEAIDDATKEGSVYVYVEDVPNYNDGGMEIDIDYSSIFPVAKCVWEIKCRKNEELYTITKFVKEVQVQKDQNFESENQKLKDKIENLEIVLSRISSLVSSNSSSDKSIEISPSDFMTIFEADVAKHFDDEENGKEDLVTEFFNREIVIAYKGFTTTFYNGAEWANFFEELQDEGIYD